MASDRFEVCVGFILRQEGGYVNHPSDPGGETNHGITWPTLKAAITQLVVPPDTAIKTLTEAQAKDIYFHLYWKASRADELPEPLDLVMFDAAVNHGLELAVKQLQRSLMVIPVDGVMGPKTIDAAQRPAAILESRVTRFLVERAVLYHRLSLSSDVFFRGWIRRILELQAEAHRRAA